MLKLNNLPYDFRTAEAQPPPDWDVKIRQYPPVYPPRTPSESTNWDGMSTQTDLRKHAPSSGAYSNYYTETIVSMNIRRKHEWLLTIDQS